MLMLRKWQHRQTAFHKKSTAPKVEKGLSVLGLTHIRKDSERLYLTVTVKALLVIAVRSHLPFTLAATSIL